MGKIETAQDAKRIADAHKKVDIIYNYMIESITKAAEHGEHYTKVLKYFDGMTLTNLNKEVVKKLSSVGFKCDHFADECGNFYLNISWK
jgi:hypothetical protein